VKGADLKTVPGVTRPARTAAWFAVLIAGCGSSHPVSQAPPTPPPSAVADAGPPDAAPPPPPPKERPFAHSPTEATGIIQHEIDARMPALWDCVQAYRKANRDAHQTIVVSLGIDEDGNLLGVASGDPKHGDVPPPVRKCILRALHDAAFPRSHAGIISVRQTFQDTAVYP
jgi:hypothetical protein